MRFVAAVAILGIGCVLHAAPVQAQAQVSGFSIVLVFGETQGGGISANVPPAVRKTLMDVKDFLPYDTYRVLDTQLVATSSAASTRLVGLDGQEYEVELQTRTAASGLEVKFKLQEAGAPASAAEAESRAATAAELEKQRLALERGIADWRDQKGPGVDDRMKGLEARLALLNKSIAAARASKLIDTTFEMAVGETTVVGTSRIRGDKALIVLLTARPRTK